MTSEIIAKVSGFVADAVNNEDFDILADNINDILYGINDDERKAILQEAKVICVMASQPGCLPDAWSSWGMNSNPEDIREETMTIIGEDDFEADETDWTAALERVNSLDLAGDCMNAPDGRVIEVFEKSCADILKDNKIF